MKTIIETKRLFIRELISTDIDDMLTLHSDPEVHRYLGNKTITNKEELIKIINVIRQQYVDFGVGRWAMINKKTNKFMGWTGLEFVIKETNKHKNYYDLGYRLMKEFWGQGFATESAFASLEYGFNNLNLTTIYAIADIQNKGSNKILQKIGLQLIETFQLEKTKHNWYKIEKSEYKNIN